MLGGILIVTTSYFNQKFIKKSPNITAEGLVISLLTICLSDWICKDYSLLYGPSIRGEAILLSLASMWFLYTGKIQNFLKLFLGISIILLIYFFFDVAKGNFIFTDDHSVVVYRLTLLKENFPFIPFYNPIWNAGLDARDFFATGILNLFSIWSWLIYFFDVRDVYNIIVSITIFAFAPLLIWLACKIDELDDVTAMLASLLSLATHLFWYRWALKYGSMGFVTSTIFIPLNIILIKRIIFNQTLPKWGYILATISITLMLFWSVTGIIILPLILIGAFNIKSLWKRPEVRKLIFSLCILNLPWIILFLSVSKVATFIDLQKKSAKPIVEQTQEEKPQELSRASLKGKVKKITIDSLLFHIRDMAIPLNPVLLTLGILGIFTIKSKHTKYIFLIMLGWLLLLGFIISPLKPQFELDRMLIVLALLLTIPAANVVTELIHKSKNNKGYTALTLLPLSFIFAGTFSVANIIYDRTPEKIKFANSVYYDLGASIKKNALGGRAVFIGFVLHELNQGHLAPLMQETNTPMVASTLYHNLWRYTEVIPYSFLSKGSAGYERYLDMMNSSLVIAHEKKWRDYLISNPDKYEFIEKIDIFNIFRRKNFTPNYFMSGSGEVLYQDSHSINLKLHTKDVTIKFNYFPFLKASSCQISPMEISPEINFIHLSNCDISNPIKIESVSGFSRVYTAALQEIYGDRK